MIIVVRLRGHVGVRQEMEDTLRLLGIPRANSAVVLPKNERTLGMVRKVECFVAWGEPDGQLQKKFADNGNKMRLKPPRKGLKAVNRRYPEGDLGYRGAEINKLIERMM